MLFRRKMKPSPIVPSAPDRQRFRPHPAAFNQNPFKMLATPPICITPWSVRLPCGGFLQLYDAGYPNFTRGAWDAVFCTVSMIGGVYTAHDHVSDEEATAFANLILQTKHDLWWGAYPVPCEALR